MGNIPQAGPASPPTAENIIGLFQSIFEPKKISTELAAFMDIDTDSTVTLSKCIMFVMKYIDDNGLRNPTNPNEFSLDQRLKELFHIPEETIHIDIIDLSMCIIKHINLQI